MNVIFLFVMTISTEIEKIFFECRNSVCLYITIKVWFWICFTVYDLSNSGFDSILISNTRGSLCPAVEKLQFKSVSILFGNKKLSNSFLNQLHKRYYHRAAIFFNYYRNIQMDEIIQKWKCEKKRLKYLLTNLIRIHRQIMQDTRRVCRWQLGSLANTHYNVVSINLIYFYSKIYFQFDK